MIAANWTPADLPPLAGKTYLITGGNSGIGFAAAQHLSSNGARVVITARTDINGQRAVKALRENHPNASVDYLLLDLTNTASIHRAATTISQKCPKLAAIVNNAGIMQAPQTYTEDGFELHLATNHLGHFALNSLLMPHLEHNHARVVVVSSFIHRVGRINFNNLMRERRYERTLAYAQSKLANMLYAHELQRRLTNRASNVNVYLCHPGWAHTNLCRAGNALPGTNHFWRLFHHAVPPLIAQSADKGAYSTVFAAASDRAQPVTFYGPTQWGDTSGHLGVSPVSAMGRNQAVAHRLWHVSEQLVGSFFDEAQHSQAA